MPASGCRVTMLFQDDLYAISETHDYVGAVDLTSVVKPTKNLVTARMMCMGQGILFVEARLSMEGVWRDSLILTAGDVGPLQTQSGVLTSGVQMQEPSDADQAKACLLMRAQASPTQHKPIYLAGVPDAVIGEDPRVNRAENFPMFWQALTGYMNYLCSGIWGSVFRTIPAGNFAWFQCSGYANDPDVGGLFGFEIPAATATFKIGDKIQLRNFTQVNRAYTTPNGQWQIAYIKFDTPAVGTNRYLLFGSANVAAATVKLPGFVQRVDYETKAYQSWNYLGQTTRKRGNRQLVGVGRRSIKKRIGA